MPPGPVTTAGYWGSTYWSKGYWGADYWKERVPVPIPVPIPQGVGGGGAGAFRVDSLDNCTLADEAWKDNVKQLLTETGTGKRRKKYEPDPIKVGSDQLKRDRDAQQRCLRDLQAKVERIRKKLERTKRSEGSSGRRRREIERLQLQLEMLFARIEMIEARIDADRQIEAEFLKKEPKVERIIEKIIYVPQPVAQPVGMGDVAVEGFNPIQYGACAAITGIVTHYAIPDDWELVKGIGYAATAILVLKFLQGVLDPS